MEQGYFYLTITDNGKNIHDAHTIKETYDLRNFDAYNQGETDQAYPDVLYQRMCLRYPSTGRPKIEELGELFYPLLVGKLLNLPKDLKITLHFVTNSTTEQQCRGCFIDEKTLRDLAMLNADFIMFGQLHSLPFDPAFAYAVSTEEPSNEIPDNYIEFFVHSYRHSVADISDKLGFSPNGKCHNFNDLRKSQKPYYLTTFLHTSNLAKTLPLENHITQLTNELYLSKDKILRLGDDIDISYRFGITGNMPNPYQFTIDSDTLHKLAEMRMSVDIDMYFAND